MAWTATKLISCLTVAGLLAIIIICLRPAGRRRDHWTAKISQVVNIDICPIEDWEIDLEEDILNDPWYEIEKRQERRKALLEEVCMKTYDFESICLTGYSKFYGDHKLKMLTVPLVGSGSGAALLGLTLVRGNDTEYATEKLVKSSNPSDLMTQEAFLKSIETPNLYTTSNPRKSAAPNKCLLTYYKFIFVRDPLVRLLTAYEAEKESVRTETKGNGSLAFSDFIADTLNQKIEWQDYQYSEPCRVPWDFIGHMDTFEEDYNYILQKVLGTKHTVQSLFGSLDIKRDLFIDGVTFPAPLPECGNALMSPEGCVNGNAQTQGGDEVNAPRQDRGDVNARRVTFVDGMSKADIKTYFSKLSGSVRRALSKTVNLDARMFGYNPSDTVDWFQWKVI